MTPRSSRTTLLAAICTAVLLSLQACGGGGGGGTPGSATPADAGGSAASSPTPGASSPAPGASSPEAGASTPAPGASTPAPAASSAEESASPTVTVDMPAIYTPSQNLGLVFLQGGRERKIRYENNVQVVSVDASKTFEILVPGRIDYGLFTCIELNSTYVAGSAINVGGAVMARGYPSDENATIGWDIRTGWFSRSYNGWEDYELPTNSKGYKVLKIKSVIGGGTLPADLDLLVYSPKAGSSYLRPGTNEYEFMKLRLLPAAAAPASSAASKL